MCGKMALNFREFSNLKFKMEAMDEDEDVVFEGSELHKHFENIGIASSDYLCFQHKTIEEQCDNKTKTNNFFSFEMIKFKLGNYFKSLKKYVIINPVVPCCREYFNKIMESDVLTQDDAYFIENCLPLEMFDKNKINYFYHYPYRLIVAGLVFLAFFVNLYLYDNAPYAIFALSISNVFIFILGIYCLLECIRYWIYVKVKIVHQKNEKSVRDVIENCSFLQKLFKKSILLIQEFELVSRGFTLILPQVSAATLERKSPLQRSHQCPALRKIIYSSTIDTINAFRAATLDLLSSFQLSSGIDHSWHYIATVALDEFKSINSTSEDSIDGLKSNWQLSCIQMSEFFRRLCLCLSPDSYWENTQKEEKNLDIFWNIYGVLVAILEKIEPILIQTQRSYQFHKSVSVPSNSASKTRTHFKVENNLQKTLIAVHSLSLHLQSALAKVNHLENELEVESATDNEEFYTTCSHHLQSVQMELSSCLSCHEETKKQIDIIFGKNSPAPRLTDNININPQTTIVNQTEPISLFDMGDPIAEDQVFEAYVTEDGISCSDSDDDIIIEKEEKRRQKETSKHMMNELKCILTVKANEWQEREAKALAKNPGIKKDPEIEDIKTIFSNNHDQCIDHSNDVEGGVVKDKNQAEMHLRNDAIEKQNDIKPIHVDDTIRENIEERLQQYSQASQLGFTASIAAMAAARSRQINLLSVETFSDSEQEED